MNRDNRITIRLTDDEMMILKRISDTTDRSISECLRDALMRLGLQMYDDEVEKVRKKNEELMQTLSDIKIKAEEST
jgi:Ribbon-helix-helix protein, copG family.